MKRRKDLTHFGYVTPVVKHHLQSPVQSMVLGATAWWPALLRDSHPNAGFSPSDSEALESDWAVIGYDISWGATKCLKAETEWPFKQPALFDANEFDDRD